MGRVRQSGTAPELVVRKILRTLGAGYRIGARDLPGRPDLSNKRSRWAIFVHGCYWHHHTNCRAGTVPKNNRDFWTEKFATNRARDARAVRTLRLGGFRVALVWECQTRDPTGLSARLARLVRTRSAGRALAPTRARR